MTKRFCAALVIAAMVAGTAVTVSAQASGLGFAAFGQGNVFEGFYGPWRTTPTGVDILFAVLCVSLPDRTKAMIEVVASIPDGSTLAQLRTLSTTAVVDGCAGVNITVPRGAVFLPVLQAGQ